MGNLWRLVNAAEYSKLDQSKKLTANQCPLMAADLAKGAFDFSANDDLKISKKKCTELTPESFFEKARRALASNRAMPPLKHAAI